MIWLAVQVTEQVDLRRDVIKAESAAVSIPELEMELGIGTLGGLITTVEVTPLSFPLRLGDVSLPVALTPCCSLQ